MKTRFFERGSLPEQLEHYDEQQRARQVLNGNLDRPWASFALKPRPHRIAGGKFTRYTATPIKRNALIIDPYAVDAVMMSRIPSHHWKNSRFTRIHVSLSKPYWTEEGPKIGGDLQREFSHFDFSRTPVMDNQKYLDCQGDGVLRSGLSGEFSVVRNDRFIDLCVGEIHHHFTRAAVNYRFFAKDEEFIEVLASGSVSHGDKLASLRRPLTYGAARINERGIPLMEYIPEDVLPALRKRPLFRLCNKLNKAQNDMIPRLNKGSVSTPLSPEQWLPRALLEIPFDLAGRLTSIDGFEITSFTQSKILEGVSAGGFLVVRAAVSGKYGGCVDHPNYAHLKIIKIGDYKQIVPSTVVIHNNIKLDQHVEHDKPIGDICTRMTFMNWDDFVNEVRPENLGWIVNQALQQMFIRSGECGWQGYGSLIDIRALPSKLWSIAARRHDGHISWRLDCRGCEDYVDTQDGFITFPPLFHPLWDNYELRGNGIVYSFEPFDERFRPNGKTDEEQEEMMQRWHRRAQPADIEA